MLITSTKLRNSVLLIMSIMFLFSCRSGKEVVSSGPFQKRKYQQGWHFNSGSLAKEKQNNRIPITSKEKDPPSEEGSLGAPAEDELIASNSELPTLGLKKRQNTRKIIQGEPNECAVITKRNGEEIKAQVKEVGTNKIKYKKCGREEGPLYTIRKADVFMIKYPDGSRDVFNKQEEEAQQPQKDDRNDSQQDRTNSHQDEDEGNDALAIIGFIFSLFGLMFVIFGLFASGPGLFIVGMVLTVIALFLSAFGDGGLGTAGVVLSIISLVIGLGVLALAYALLV